MSNTNIETRRLILTLDSLESARAKVDAMSATDKEQLSAEWLALLDSATSADPWILGFQMVRRDNEVSVGQCGFKGPPTPDGVVEIAYCVNRENEGQGYATEAAQALIDYAFQHKGVSRVRAHTLPEANASTRVLTKCGFDRVGEVVDPEDGPVWRWEKQRNAS
jgi:RimJ/RimL family protein N-acetyltransferase